MIESKIIENLIKEIKIKIIQCEEEISICQKKITLLGMINSTQQVDEIMNQIKEDK